MDDDAGGSPLIAGPSSSSSSSSKSSALAVVGERAGSARGARPTPQSSETAHSKGGGRGGMGGPVPIPVRDPPPVAGAAMRQHRRADAKLDAYDGHQPQERLKQSVFSSPVQVRDVEMIVKALRGAVETSPLFASSLSQRLTTLRMLKSLWSKGNMADCIGQLRSLVDSCTTFGDSAGAVVVGDFLQAIHATLGRGLTLDTCARLLPVLETVLGEGTEALCVRGAKSICAICEGKIWFLFQMSSRPSPFLTIFMIGASVR